ncbi:hypothetical protein BTJ40_18935 [Microbulbifer sp. A4B17]|nr:hypothetical protein BTJ40_18935 [Microbulbifer sp. A4B17]
MDLIPISPECAIGSKGIQCKLSGQAGIGRCEVLLNLIELLVRVRTPNFALDSVFVTVDGWDHLFGLVALVQSAFLQSEPVMMTQSQTYYI